MLEQPDVASATPFSTEVPKATMPFQPVAPAYFINTILLGGSTSDKIDAAHAAGFAGVEVWTHDVPEGENGADRVRSDLRRRDMSVIDFQVLRDFDGAPAHRRQSAREAALIHLDLAVSVGAPMVLVAASTDPDAVVEWVVDDVRWLADEAAARQLRVAYESLSWSSRIATLPQAWDVVRRADRDNVGLVIDPFHVFAVGRTESDLDGIEMDKVFLVQLSDLAAPVGRDQLVEMARHHRLLPGEGFFGIHSLLVRILRAGYDGPLGLEVFNDEMKAASPEATARRAMGALRACVERAEAEVRSLGVLEPS